MNLQQITYEIQRLNRRVNAALALAKAANPEIPVEPGDPDQEEPQGGTPALIGGNNNGDFLIYTEDEKSVSIGASVVPENQVAGFYLQSGNYAGLEINSYGSEFINTDGLEGTSVIKSNSSNGLSIISASGLKIVGLAQIANIETNEVTFMGNGDAASDMYVYATNDLITDGSANIGAYTDVSGIYLESYGSTHATLAGITRLYAQGDFHIQAANGITLDNVPEYIDNADAIADGKDVGFVYRTGDDLKIVH